VRERKGEGAVQQVALNIKSRNWVL